ncbi:DUF1376 domain-containing protein [Cupriavidus sp. CuC1]|uniref:DUF1376 domain-containing protein n=1 Tax=Cupriavidus sp. CuC1 TaxID=3373131 RepID=UPI0037D5BA10
MTAPEPLTPADCDLKDFAFMPLDVSRLRDSELASNETPEACWAAVLLWSASWHQVPAASMPNDEMWIATQARYAIRGKIDKAWKDVRPGALRGWIECSDGRLYHPVVAEKARDAWKAKLEQRWRTECGRIKKHNDRHEGANVPKPTFEEWMSLGCPQGHPLFVPRDTGGNPEDKTGDNASKRQGEGQGQGDPTTSVPDGTGGMPPVKSPDQMTKDELWAAGKSLLAQAGTPEKQCGSIVGKLVADYTPEIVIEAVRAAVIERPADPIAYLKACCQHAAGQRKAPNKQEALEANNRAVADRLAAELAGAEQ